MAAGGITGSYSRFCVRAITELQSLQGCCKLLLQSLQGCCRLLLKEPCLERIPSVLERIPSVLERIPSVLEMIPSVLERIPSMLERIRSRQERLLNVGDYCPLKINAAPETL